jgi:hypothetical protein
MALMMLVSRAVAQGQGQSPPQGLLASADAIVAVEIVSTDYAATAADGPMVAAAKVLKVLKGPLTPERQVRFFIERAAVSDLSLPSLDAFLKRIETSTDNRKKAVFAKGQ